jgi:hypothetical protein
VQAKKEKAAFLRSCCGLTHHLDKLLIFAVEVYTFVPLMGVLFTLSSPVVISILYFVYFVKRFFQVPKFSFKVASRMRSSLPLLTLNSISH